MFKKASKVILSLATALVVLMTLGVVVKADQFVGVKSINNGKLTYYTHSEYTGNLMSGEDGAWFEGSLFYGKTKTTKIAKNCKYYTWEFEGYKETAKRISKSEFYKIVPKSTKAGYYMSKNGIKYYGCYPLQIKVKNNKIVKMRVTFVP